ncbi:MAG: hypothetical protein J6I98_05395 [Clostridia bacterium]|nr:hypothetical protein [Clostridia bacterium]
MRVHFDVERMAKVRETHDRWWRGELDRPLTSITITDAYPAEPCAAPVLSQETCADFSYSAEEVIDAMDCALGQREYLGDAFPIVHFSAFGPGSLAAFCGAKLDNSSGRVWFFAEREMEIEEIHAKYDPENIYAKRIKALYRAGLEKWNGAVMMSMPDLGGVMDVASSLRGSENLLMDLYDAPEEVLRLIGEIETAWYEAYADFASVLKPQNGYTDWSALLSSVPSYITQCDFSYMIGNPMFREFVLPTLQRDTQRLTNIIYHLDGIGELNHLDDILAIEKLHAIQWQMGDGQKPAEEWPEVYEKIRACGKEAWIVGKPESYLKVLERIHGTPYYVQSMQKEQMELAERILRAR